MWTIARVKNELPSVNVRFPTGEEKPAEVYGRLLPFARVRWEGYGVVEVAWQTVADCLNEDRPISL